MYRLLICILLLLAGPRGADAGAWMRETGGGFVAATATPRIDHNGYQSVETALYGEYGVSNWLTLGLDLNHAMSWDEIGGHALVFARFPILQKGKLRLAIEAAAGQHMRNEHRFAMSKLTVSAGRGLSPDWGSKWGHGWIAIDLAGENRTGLTDPIVKLDMTLGLPNYGRIGPMLQVETAKIRDKPLFWTVTPGIRYETKKAGTYVVGVERKTIGENRFWGLKFGLWRSF